MKFEEIARNCPWNKNGLCRDLNEPYRRTSVSRMNCGEKSCAPYHFIKGLFNKKLQMGACDKIDGNCEECLSGDCHAVYKKG